MAEKRRLFSAAWHRVFAGKYFRWVIPVLLLGLVAPAVIPGGYGSGSLPWSSWTHGSGSGSGFGVRTMLRVASFSTATTA